MRERSVLRRTIEAILWRREHRAELRAMPDIYGPWWMAAQIFIRWSRLGVLEQLLHLAQRCGISLGMRFGRVPARGVATAC
jgi:hypothetical protein